MKTAGSTRVCHSPRDKRRTWAEILRREKSVKLKNTKSPLNVFELIQMDVLYFKYKKKMRIIF